jgi:hypothetical protein
MDLATAANGGPIEWAQFHREHRDLVSLNDWRMARRNISGCNMRDFLIKCAYFFACQNDWTIDQFAHECEIGISTAYEFDRRMRGVYPACAGLSFSSTKTTKTKTAALANSSFFQALGLGK